MPLRDSIRSTKPHRWTIAYTDPIGKVSHMVRVLAAEGWTPEQWKAGELWVRWGMDGVPLWSRSYLTLTVSVGKTGPAQPLHSASDFQKFVLIVNFSTIYSTLKNYFSQTKPSNADSFVQNLTSSC